MNFLKISAKVLARSTHNRTYLWNKNDILNYIEMSCVFLYFYLFAELIFSFFFDNMKEKLALESARDRAPA